MNLSGRSGEMRRLNVLYVSPLYDLSNLLRHFSVIALGIYTIHTPSVCLSGWLAVSTPSPSSVM